MRLSISILGTEVLCISTDPEPDEDMARDLSGGNLSATPMGFVASMERPHEIDTPDRDW